MKKIFALLICFSSYLSAQVSPDTWNCISHDSSGKEWLGSSNFQRSALNLAIQACKNASFDPKTCISSNEECEALSNGHSTRPLWRCVALDQMAKPWESNLYSKRDDAAIAAKAYCEDQSGFPDSCYINLMTCKSVNLYD